MGTPKQHLSEEKQAKKERQEEDKRIQKMLEQRVKEDYESHMQRWREEEEKIRREKEQNVRAYNLTDEQKKLRRAIRMKRRYEQVRASSKDENSELRIWQQRPRARLSGFTLEERRIWNRARKGHYKSKASRSGAHTNEEQSHLCPEADLSGPGDFPAKEVPGTPDSSRGPMVSSQLHTSENSLVGAGRAGSVAVMTSPMSIGFLLNER